MKSALTAGAFASANDIVRTPAEHRTAVATTGGKRPYPVLAWPTLSRIQKANRPDLALALLTWRDLNEPPTIGAANDNHEYGGIESGVYVEKFVDAVGMMGEDGEWGFRPSPKEMIRAACDEGPFHPRGALSSKPRRTVAGWRLIERKPRRLVRAPWPQHEYFFYGRLMFGPAHISGKQDLDQGGDDFAFLGIVERNKGGGWKRSDGRWNLKRPGDTWRRPRGVGAPKKPEPVVPHYLTPGVAILAGAEFIGVQPKTIISTPANDNTLAEDDLARMVDAGRLRQALGTNADLLDYAASPLTAEEIGERFGHAGQYARRWAVKAIDDAILRFDALRADLNIPQTRRFAA
jgi:hypothetical protein